jgi:DNA-binding winged helix-turn-helix (wHTH) protein/TolB-like protein/Flp pilus assembly protein TadD
MPEELLHFGPFELDPEREELRRSGLVLRLPRQPFRILLLLVRRAGEVVSRDEIHAAIWGNETHVDFEHGINSAIRQIRFALGDHAGTPRYVRTLPRRGYSFIASVAQSARPGESAPEPEVIPVPRRRRVAAIAATIVIAIAAMAALIAESRWSTGTKRSSGREVAVLPFRRLGPAIAGVDERSFAEELRATIGRLPRAHVAVIDDAARADLVLDGTIRQSDDGVRVIVSLVDASSKTRIWSDTFQRPAEKKEGMAVEVAHEVMHEIARRFLPPARHEPPLRTNAPPGAVALYNRARMLHARSQAYDWMRTNELYEAAIRKEPRFAEAWSGLSDVLMNHALRGPAAESAAAATRAMDCARRAIALQPENAEAHSTLGVIAAQRDYDLAAAEDSMRRATSADPGYVDAHANLALVLAMRGQFDEALREYVVARQLDPILFDLHPMEGLLHLQARRYEDARARYREILAVKPDLTHARWGLLSIHILQKNWPEALAVARSLPQFPPVENVPATEAGFLKVYRGYGAYMQSAHGRAFNDYSLALYHGQLGDRDRAFQRLHRAIDVREPTLSYIMVDPRIDTLRTDPRFNAVLARMELGRPPTPVRLKESLLVVVVFRSMKT